MDACGVIREGKLRFDGVEIELGFAESVLRRTSWVGAERMKEERLEDRRRCRCQENVKLMRLGLGYGGPSRL